MKYLERIKAYLDAAYFIKNPDRSNTGKILWDIYLWQEVASRAKKRLEAAWHLANVHGLVPKDEQLREVIGERVVLDTKFLSCRARVDPGRQMFDRDMFITRIARKYKLPIADLIQDAEECVVRSQPVLAKRVTEKEKNSNGG